MTTQFIYEHTDIPVGMTAAEYRRLRAEAKRGAQRRGRRTVLRRLARRSR